MEIEKRVSSKLSAKAFEEQMIPKHRFDCINLCLKETKELLKERLAENQLLKVRIEELEKELFESKVETILAINGAKNVTAVKALIDFDALEENCDISALDEQIRILKENQSYLFESREEISYVLVPVNSNDPLNKSIANYVKKIGRVEK